MMPNTKSVATVAPIVLLGGALLLLLLHPVPVGNRDLVVAIVSGLLGYLVHPVKHGEKAE